MSSILENAMSASPYYGDAGWVNWPDDLEFSFEFLRVLAASQEGASTISECFLAAKSIRPGDSETWYEAWKEVGDRNRFRADKAFARNELSSATGNWLRASNYYRTADAFMHANDARREQLIQGMKACSHLYLQHIRPAGEVVETVQEGGRLEGYFLRPPLSRGLLPVVICIGGLGVEKDDLLYTMQNSAAQNHVSLLLLDSVGTAGAYGLDPSSSNDIENAVGCWVDYLLARSDVDPMKIAIYGDGLGAQYATKIASRDHRFAAAVCDGGLWQRHESSFLMRRFTADNGLSIPVTLTDFANSIVPKIKCPVLVTIGQRDFIAVESALEMQNAWKLSGVELDLKVFSVEETGAAPGHADNPTLAREFAFGWIRGKLGLEPLDSPLLAWRRKLDRNAPASSSM
jgi:hypothetical protein